MAKTIMSHRVIRGSLVHQVQDVQFCSLTQALCAASAAHALQDMQARRTAALACMRQAGDDMAAFSEASRQEAQLAAHIRRLKRVQP